MSANMLKLSVHLRGRRVTFSQIADKNVYNIADSIYGSCLWLFRSRRGVYGRLWRRRPCAGKALLVAATINGDVSESTLVAELSGNRMPWKQSGKGTWRSLEDII